MQSGLSGILGVDVFCFFYFNKAMKRKKKRLIEEKLK
jgi:hypothetical protein